MNSKQTQITKFLAIIFILLSIFHMFYASSSLRVLYIDGSSYCAKLIDNISNGIFGFVVDESHPRVCAMALSQFIALIVGLLFNISKNTIAILYSFGVFLMPLLALWWNYTLTKRTKQYSILFWSLFSYALILVGQIYSIVESYIGVIFQFVLLNYL